MFFGCTSLENMPNISKWNTQNVTDFSYMFSYCYSLLILPKTNKWITTNEADRSNMTHGCSESASALKIYIKTMRGETIDIACKMDESISSIKEKLEKLKNIPLAKQKLFYDSRELEDSKSLTDYNIEENMNIHLVANMN
jgi:surface protein